MMTPITVFGPDDFVFVDEMFNPYFVHNTGDEGQPETWWLHYWHDGQQSWLTLKNITEAERERFRRRSLSRIHAELYFAK
jgi:hypothetical protein